MSFEETLRRIERKLEKIESEVGEIRQRMILSSLPEQRSLVLLPDHLRKTALELLKIGQGTASDVGRFTKRTRAVESGYLNQLERQGYVTSFRRGRHKVFSVPNTKRAKTTDASGQHRIS
jgi:DNA-binding transcriptional ArsR family regulator